MCIICQDILYVSRDTIVLVQLAKVLLPSLTVTQKQWRNTAAYRHVHIMKSEVESFEKPFKNAFYRFSKDFSKDSIYNLYLSRSVSSIYTFFILGK